MRSKYESLQDGALFRFLKIVLSEFRRMKGNDDLPRSSAKTSATLSVGILKKYGLTLDNIDINYFWVCLLLNLDKIEGEEKLGDNRLGLTRPEIKNYEITLEFYGSCSYSEYMDLEYTSYNIETARDIRNNDIEHSGDYYGFETGECEGSDVQLDSIDEIPLSESKKKKKVIKEQNSSNDIDISNLSLYELVNLKEQIENRIVHKMNIG